MPAPLAPHPEALRTFAASRTGEYAVRYGEILAEAFSRHGLLLNAKQLRELAGGGSQTTAQQAIEEWRKNLSERLAPRVRLGALVPEEVLQAANSLLESLWVQAREHAGQEFASQRSQHEAARAQAVERLAEVRQELLQARDELEQSKGLVASKDAQLRDLRNELATCQASLTETGAKLEHERQARAEQSLRERSAQEALQSAVRESKAHEEQLRQDLVHGQRDAAQRHDRMLVEHREAVASVQRSCDARLAERDAHAKALQSKLEAATAQELALQIQSVRNAGEIQHLTQNLTKLQEELAAARAELQQSRQQTQAAQAQLIEHLKAPDPQEEPPAAPPASGRR